MDNEEKKSNESGKPDLNGFLRQIAAGKKFTMKEFDDWEKEYKKWIDEQLATTKSHLKRIEEYSNGEKCKKQTKKQKPNLAFACDTGNFKIGNPVIAIQDHSENLFKTGDVFLLRGLKMGCHCSPLLLDIGLEGFDTACHNCGIDTFEGAWMNAHRFEPLETKSNYTTDSLLDELTK